MFTRLSRPGLRPNVLLSPSLRTIHTPPRWPRSRKAGKFLAYTALGTSAVYLVDKNFYASSLTRTMRTWYTGAIIALDYKLYFNAANADAIPQLHERVAERLFNCLYDNGGLYIKLGQAIAANTALLPPAFQSRFATLFDDAPQIPFADVERVICREFGVKSIDDVFSEFESEAVASASIAQVHRARLKDGNGEDGRGTLVAVKVQKPDVTQQVEWDLTAYKALMW
jgi:aarF domain-containing kinase